MKKQIITVLLLAAALVGRAQTCTTEDVKANKEGNYSSYTNNNNEVFAVGDTLRFGKAAGVSTYKYLSNSLAAVALSSNAVCSAAVIKKISVKKQRLEVTTKKPLNGGLGGVFVSDLDQAIAAGEVITSVLTSDQALSKLKTEKDKLDLGVITPEQYEAKKQELSKYIK